MCIELDVLFQKAGLRASWSQCLAQYVLDFSSSLGFPGLAPGQEEYRGVCAQHCGRWLSQLDGAGPLGP